MTAGAVSAAGGSASYCARGSTRTSAAAHTAPARRGDARKAASRYGTPLRRHDVWCAIMRQLRRLCVDARPEVRAAAVDFDRGVAEVLVPDSVSAASLSAELTFEKYTAKPLTTQP